MTTPRSTIAMLLLLSAMTVACARRQPPPTPTFTVVQAEGPYRLQVGDVIAVQFYRTPELNQETTVRPDGMITMPLIGEVRAVGFTPAELDAAMARRYVGELSNDEIRTVVRTSVGQRVYVAGEVGKPGVMPLSGRLTLYQAIQQAGGMLKSAHRKEIVLIRQCEGDKPVGRTLDIRPIESGEHPEADVVLCPSDVVFVPRSKIANVNLFVEMYVRNNMPISYIPAMF